MAEKDNNMKSRGLGDSIHKFTKATGIKRMVDTVSKGLNIPCGCEGRQKAMNMMFPYSRKKKILWVKLVDRVKQRQKENLKFGLALMLLAGV